MSSPVPRGGSVQTQLSPRERSRLLIFEGIMGAGKSTACRAYGERIKAAGFELATFTEAADPHPVRASDDLPDFFQPWLYVDAGVLASRVRAKWARYVARRLDDRVFTIMDGQLFHGDLTHLFMMEMTTTDLTSHVSALMDVLAPLRPVVVYFRHADLERGMRSVFRARGAEWESYQLGWKLRSPYATRRSLEGMEGFVRMNEAYRALTDSLFASLHCPKLAIDTDAGDWPAHDRKISRLLEAEVLGCAP